MATKKVRTNAGHDAGPAGGRWLPRSEAKASAKKRRRAASSRLQRNPYPDHEEDRGCGCVFPR